MLERFILIVTWIILTVLLLLFVPKEKIREANVIFFFKQLLTWILGLVIVEKNLIKYPVRFFKNACKTSFTFEYFAYPSICVFFNLFYPFGESILKQITHYIVYTSGITFFEVILEKHTQLIKYIKWKWYFTWISICITFLLSNLYYRWFFHL